MPFLLQTCKSPPIAVTVFFGANDAALLGRTNERQYVPVEEYKENLKKIVHRLKVCCTSFSSSLTGYALIRLKVSVMLRVYMNL